MPNLATSLPETGRWLIPAPNLRGVLPRAHKFGPTPFTMQINNELNLATSDAGVVNELIERVFLPDLMISTEVNEPVELAMTAKLAEMFVDELL